jgi:hypothetical protein
MEIKQVEGSYPEEFEYLRNGTFINLYPPKIIGGNFISIKKDSDRKHGYGMKSIDKIVNKYHGSHIEQFDENEFTISIILMI